MRFPLGVYLPGPTAITLRIINIGKHVLHTHFFEEWIPREEGFHLQSTPHQLISKLPWQQEQPSLAEYGQRKERTWQ